MTKLLSVVMGVVFIFQCINEVYLHLPFESYLALSPACLERGWVWQLITFQFLHGSVWHLLGNLLVFWWVGHFVESLLGRKRFLIALFGAGAVGGLLQVVLMVLFPFRYGEWVVGASAGVAGLFAIFALLEKDTELRVYFVLPVRAITLLWFFGIISLFFTLVPSVMGLGVAHAAHLGGILAGLAWVKLGWHHDYVQLPWEGWLDRLRNLRQPRNRRSRDELVATHVGKSKGWSPSPGARKEDVSADEFLRREVDPILDKISAHGIQSLTAREREILEKARSKMGKS